MINNNSDIVVGYIIDNKRKWVVGKNHLIKFNIKRALYYQKQHPNTIFTLIVWYPIDKDHKKILKIINGKRISVNLKSVDVIKQEWIGFLTINYKKFIRNQK